LASPAGADDQPHIVGSDVANIWHAGCALTYSLTPQSAEYAPYVETAYAAISGPTNFTFTRLPDGDQTASIRIRVNPEWTTGISQTIGGTRGLIYLAPSAAFPDSLNAVDNTNFRINVVAHVTLHSLGLGDDPTNTEREVMTPTVLDEPLTFGPSDLAGLTVLKNENHCISPGVQDPAFTTPVIKHPWAPAKALCKKNHGTWYVKYHVCIMRRH
jgi:hypothetical protein